MFHEVLAHIHPILVHFPIVLTITGLGFDIVQTVRYRELHPRRGAWIWTAAAIAAMFAVATGPEEDARGNTTLLRDHQLLADLTLWLVLLYTAWRLWSVWRGHAPWRKVKLWISLLVTGVATVTVLGAGYYGGMMVYDQGIGVQVNGKAVNPPVHHPRHTGGNQG
ncbi:MAG: hypothetical protein K6T81_16720 [Alicyclobacillus macrosporangiidus]|uniref:DUF2231 domain-containing protein n=1 Tax=Alicyclobacillus macrosporangiidus TaxID=392015 RepID=UPI0026EBEC71|nr:DUF2231 domain-containing protein [Alicyclobacillus macrosporangiidus]MCL6600356.1 hypothetical protein [Alicyclobacillus macrosporangiidus]